MRRSQFFQAMVIAAAVEVVGTVLTLIGNFLTDSSPKAWQALLVPGVAILVVSVKAGVGAVLKTPAEGADTNGYTSYGGGVYGPRGGHAEPAARPRPGAARTPGVSVAAALLTLLLLCGGGGYAVVYGVGYGYGWLTGNEAGTEWLAAEATGVSGELRLTVEGYTVTSHFTKVDLLAENSGDRTITLPADSRCRLISETGQTLQADPFRSDWPSDVAPGVAHRGEITFSGRLPEGQALLNFAVVFRLGGGSISVRGIQISPPGDGRRALA